MSEVKTGLTREKEETQEKKMDWGGGGGGGDGIKWGCGIR